MNTETKYYAPFTNHDLQNAMTRIFDALFPFGKVLSKIHITTDVTRYVIEYDGVKYALNVLDRTRKCISITIL